MAYPILSLKASRKPTWRSAGTHLTRGKDVLPTFRPAGTEREIHLLSKPTPWVNVIHEDLIIYLIIECDFLAPTECNSFNQ